MIGLLKKVKTLLISKSNVHYTRGITPKHVTSDVALLRGLLPGLQKNVGAVASRWRHRAGYPFLTGPEIQPRPTPPSPIACA